MNRRRLALVVLTLMAVVAIPGVMWAQKPDKKVVLGSKTFTESRIISHIVEKLVERETDTDVVLRSGLGGTRVLWSALERGEIDLYPEYTGTLSHEILNDKKIEGFEKLRQLVRKKGYDMTESLGFSNTYALGMKEQKAEKLGIRDISDLKGHSELKFGLSNEFMDREDGWPGLREFYTLPDVETKGLKHELAYQGLKSEAIDVIDLYRTDAEIQKYDIRVLRDDRDYFPAYKAVVIYRKKLDKSAPEVLRALEKLYGRISERRMRAMNAQVKIDGLSPEKVASKFLTDKFDFSTATESNGLVTRLIWRTFEHMMLVLVSLGAAIALAIPLGILAAKVRFLEQTVLGLVGILQTIPSLALLVFMIPLLGLGYWPAVAALFVYSLLPIVRTTHSGFKEISQQIRESARAIGLSRIQRMRMIELPLAARSILAGIKTSAVINIGTATLGALIGAGGYGQPILTGIRLDDMSLILEGAIPAAGLALVAQGLFELIEWRVVPDGLRKSSGSAQ